MSAAGLPNLAHLELWGEELGATCTAIGCLGTFMSAFGSGKDGPRAAGGKQHWRETERRLYAGVPESLLRLGRQLEAAMGRIQGLDAPLREAATAQAAEFLVSHMSTLNDATAVRFYLLLGPGDGCADWLRAIISCRHNVAIWLVGTAPLR